MSIEYLNGVGNWFGPRVAEDKLPALIKTEGNEKLLVVDFNYDDLPTYGANGQMNIEIPADAFIVSAHLHVVTAAAGSSAVYNIGLYQSDSTVIDADGIDASLAQATLTEDAWIACDGALIGASIGAAAGQITVALASGSHTAGSYRLYVKYIDSNS